MMSSALTFVEDILWRAIDDWVSAADVIDVARRSGATDPEILREAFAVALARLAAAASEQIAYLTSLGIADLADELALEFDDLYRPIANELGHVSNVAQTCRKRIVLAHNRHRSAPLMSRVRAAAS